MTKIELRVVDVSPSSWLVDHNGRQLWLRDDDIGIEPGSASDRAVFVIPNNIAEQVGLR